MVPGAGIEPARGQAPRDFKSLMSTYSITRAACELGLFGQRSTIQNRQKLSYCCLSKSPFLWLHGIAQNGSIHKQNKWPLEEIR